MGKSLYDSTLRLAVFGMLILSSFFLFNACNKEALIDDEIIGYRSDYATSSEMINDFYNAFNEKKSNIPSVNITVNSPFYYNINKVSAFIPSLFNDTAIIFNVSSNSLNNYSRYLANQILVKKNRFGDFEISHLVYIPDSQFYANKNYFPLLVNFTGDILEINEKSEYKSIYELNYGEITGIFDRTRNDNFGIGTNELNSISLRDAELYEEDIEIIDEWEEEFGKINHGGGKIKCPGFGGNIKHFKSKKKRRSGNGGNIVIPDLVWGEPKTNIVDWKSGGGSSGGTAPLPCQNPKTFWDTYGKPSYKNYVEALSILSKEYAISICDDIFNNNSGCSVSYENILCGTANCFSSFESTYLSLEQILGCLRTYISNVANNDSNESDCQDAIDNFNLEFGTNFTANDLLDVFDANPNICAEQNAFDELVISTYLVRELNLTNEQRLWLDLEVNLNIKHKIFEYQLNNTYPNEALNYFIWAMMNHGHDLNFYTSGYDEFGTNDTYYPVDNTKITIIESFVPYYVPNSFPKLCETPYREGHEYNPPNQIPDDMRAELTGDCKLLSKIPNRLSLCDDSANNLLINFNNLIHNPLLNLYLQDVATDYYERWVSGIGGDYYNEELSTYVLTNNHMKTTVKDFGKYLNDQLKLVNGNLNNVNWTDFKEQYRPQFGIGENTTGLKILINDTEKMIVYNMGDFIYNSSSKEWSGSFYFQTYDNFGLDTGDLLKQQAKPVLGVGFASWWILQHKWAYRPFRTELRSVFKIKGNLNN